MTLSMMKDLKELHGQIIEQQVRKIILLKYLLQIFEYFMAGFFNLLVIVIGLSGVQFRE